jgi:hypothetical protein
MLTNYWFPEDDKKMMMQAFRTRLIAAAILACFFSMPAMAEGDGAVVEVTVVKVYGSTSEYLEKVKGIIDVIKKHEPRAEVHIYQAAFAGTDYGKIHISTRYPSFAALAAANPKIVDDPDHHRAIEELAAVKREIISHYMLRDKTPK